MPGVHPAGAGTPAARGLYRPGGRRPGGEPTETLTWLRAQRPGRPAAAERAFGGGPGHWVQLLKPLRESPWALDPNSANGVAVLATPVPLDVDMPGVCAGAGTALRGAGTIAADLSDAGGSAVRPGLAPQAAMEEKLGPSRNPAGC